MFNDGDKVLLRPGVSDEALYAIHLDAEDIRAVKNQFATAPGKVYHHDEQGDKVHVFLGHHEFWFRAAMLGDPEEIHAKQIAQISADHSEYYSAITEVDHEPV